MKQFLMFLTVVLIFTVSVHAQRKVNPMKQQTEISLLGGYMFSGSYDGYQGNVDVLDKPTYGVTIGYRPNKLSTLTIEFEYLGSPAEVKLTPFTIDTNRQIENVDISVNYFLIGAGYGTQVSAKTQLFTMFKLGLVYASPSERYESVTNAAGAFTVGAKFYLSKSVGIKLHTGLYFPIRFSGGGVFVGTGGVDYGVSTTSAVTQYNVGGGLMFLF